MDLLCSLFCLLSWPLRGPLWPCPCFAYFASCHGPCVAFRGRRVALLCSRCFLSWPLRGLPWPPLGLTLLTSVAATWPYFAHFASCLGPCVSFVAPAWPCFAYFEPCLGPCVAFCGLTCSLCFLSWPLRGRGPLRVLLTLLPSLAAGPLRDFCLGPYMAFAPVWPYFAFLCFLFLLRPSVAFAWPLLSLSWALRNLLRPCMACLALRGLTLLTLLPVSALSWPSVPSRGLPALPVLALAWPSAAPAWALLALLFSTLAPPLG